MIKLIFKLLKNLVFLAVIILGGFWVYQTYIADEPTYIINIEVPEEVREQKEAQIAELHEKLQNEELTDKERVELYNSLGLIYGSLGNISEAIAQYKNARDLIPESAQVLANIGNAYAQVEEHDKAEEYFLKSLEQNPHQYHVRQSLIRSYEAMGRSKEVITNAYTEALRRMDELVGGNPERVLIDYANYLEDHEYYDDAASVWSQILLQYYEGDNDEIKERISEIYEKQRAQ